MPRFACLAGLLATGIVVATTDLSGQTGSNLDTLISRYIAVGRPAIQQAFPTEQAFRTSRGDIFQKTRDWRQQWTPTGSTFLLELSAWGLEQGWVDSVVVLRAAGDLVLRRSALVGTSAAQDTYEVTFHRAAVALLISSRLFDEAERYLDLVRLRVVAAPVPGEPRLIDPSLVLTRALLADARTAPGFVSTASRGTGLDGRPNDALKDALERADMAYLAAARVPELAPEANVRRAFVQHRLGRHNDALALLSKMAGDNPDTPVRYWRELFLGRTLEALSRPAEAALAYERAGALYPGAQTPGVALASLHQRQGEVDKAIRWAVEVRSAAAGRLDPWWQYWAGDLRRYPVWLAELRQARP